MREETAKARAKSRAAGQCEGCRATGQEISLEAHHARYDRAADEWIESDFWVLCMTCHDTVTMNTRARKLDIPAAQWRGIVRAAVKAATLEKGVPGEAVDFILRGNPGGVPDWRWSDSATDRERLQPPVSQVPPPKVAIEKKRPEMKPHERQRPSPYVHPLKR